MKKLSLIAALIVASSGAFAATTTDSFDVTITFNGTCSVKTAAADMSFTYNAFAVTGQTANTSTVFQCSRGLTPQFSFNDNGGTMTSNGLTALASNITGEGVISGIRYTLQGVTSRSQTGTAASAGTGGTGGSNGTADEYTVALTAAITAGQAGTGLGGTAVSQTRVLTISY